MLMTVMMMISSEQKVGKVIRVEWDVETDTVRLVMEITDPVFKSEVSARHERENDRAVETDTPVEQYGKEHRTDGGRHKILRIFESKLLGNHVQKNDL